MKKLTIFLTFVVLGVFIWGSIALGAQIKSQTSIGNTTFTPSSNVCVKVVSIDTQYGATSGHVNGTHQYGTCGGMNLANTCDPAKIYKIKYSGTITKVCDGVDDPQSNGGHIGSNWGE